MVDMAFLSAPSWYVPVPPMFFVLLTADAHAAWLVVAAKSFCGSLTHTSATVQVPTGSPPHALTAGHLLPALPPLPAPPLPLLSSPPHAKTKPDTAASTPRLIARNRIAPTSQRIEAVTITVFVRIEQVSKPPHQCRILLLAAA
jgi:hypothetical protein